MERLLHATRTVMQLNRTGYLVKVILSLTSGGIADQTRYDVLYVIIRRNSVSAATVPSGTDLFVTAVFYTMTFELIEPLSLLFKDEVREVGRFLELPAFQIERHPFPGPGLAVRVPGAITREDLDLLRRVDRIFIDGLKREGLYNEVWQAFAVLLPVRSVGVMGDERTYQKAAALRAVTSTDGMTADWARLPWEFLQDISNEIINRVDGVNRVVYDISSKPPSTIEWE